jgi:PAS domain S-box-containing protein
MQSALAAAMDPDGHGEYLARYRVINRLDGLARWVEATGLVTFENRVPTRLVGTVQDITDRVEATDALARSEERFRTIFQGVGMGMVLIEGDGTIRMANPAFCAIVNRPEQALLRASCLSITHPGDVDENLRLIHQLLSGAKRSATYETRYTRPDGDVRWVRINIVRQSPEDGVASEPLLAAVEDVTERIRAQIALEAAHRERQHLLEAERTARSDAEAAVRSKDEFLATLSHELRTPLSNIISWARLLQRKYVGDHVELAKGLKIIVDNAMTQSQLISDLLDMSRIVAGKVNLETVALDLADLVARSVNAHRPAAEAKALSINVEFATEIAIVLGDETRLQQVMHNLLANAVKFTPEGTPTAIQVKLRRSSDRYFVSVSDPGEGIDPHFLPHIFGRFRQSDGSNARRHGGLGLGLAIVKQLVDMHGGEVTVESGGLGTGAVFTLALPLHPAEAPRRASVASDHVDVIEGLPLAGFTILVVEDQPSILEHLKQSLEEHGASTIAVTSALAALNVLRGRALSQVDLLLSDLGLPQMDGYQLIRTIREQLNLTAERLPAIAITAFARDEDRSRSRSVGYQAHISKPYRVTEVVSTAASLLAKPKHA